MRKNQEGEENRIQDAYDIELDVVRSRSSYGGHGDGRPNRPESRDKFSTENEPERPSTPDSDQLWMSSTSRHLDYPANQTETDELSANQNIQYLVPISHQYPTNQLPPHTSSHIVQYLVPVPRLEDGGKEMYLEPAEQLMSRCEGENEAGTSTGLSPKVVYVWDTEGEPKQQEIDRDGIGERKKKFSIKFPETETEFEEEDLQLLRSSSPMLRISKSVVTIVIVVVEFILQCVVVAQMGQDVNKGDDSGIEYESDKVRCEAQDSGKGLFIAYLVIVIFQGLFMMLQVANIVGETMIDVRGRGFQIMHGFHETALSYLVNDIPLGALIIAFNGTCKLNVESVSVTAIIMKLIKNITRKNTARQKPSRSIEIPLICYTWILYSTNKEDTCTFRPRKWRVCFPAFFWNCIMYRDIGCCTDEKKVCFLDPKPWKCCSYEPPCCCVKITGCRGEGCKQRECCSCEWSPCSCPGCGILVFVCELLIALLENLINFFAWFAKSCYLLFKIDLCRKRNGHFFGEINKDFLQFQGLYRVFSAIHSLISLYLLLKSLHAVPF